jgi:tetratricopeptide (TPR) repeat protein
MRKLILPVLLASFTFTQAQLIVSPNGGNKKATVGERIGLTDVTIHYDRPHVNGREGKIWGQLVPVGFTDQGFGSSKAAPWRAGANECTTIEFSTPVKIEGQSLAAGKYGFFIAYDPKEPTLIFSKNATAWGSFFYNDKEDALRVKIKPVPAAQQVEWLQYEFSNETANSALVTLSWEKLTFPFKIEVDYINTQLESFRRQLQGENGFAWESWDQAANWCIQNNVNLEQALQWTDTSTGPIFGGSKSFQAWSTRAQLLDKLGRSDEAATIMKNSLAFASMQEIHQYGRQLLQQKKNKEALEAFKMNFAKNPKEFTAIMGMVRGLSANGDYKNALKYANQAVPLAPDPLNKSNLETMINKLKEGKDAN